MDLLETTIKVIENQNAAHEHFSVFKENLKQYEDYINAMKENLEETQLKNSRNKEILEMNNLTKNAFNENCKRVKDLFGIVYSYTQQIQERLSTIMVQQASLEETYNENEERFNNLDTKYNNSLKLLVILEKDSIEKLSKERSDIEHHLNEVNREFITLSESWKSIIDERNEKYKTLQVTTLEVEILYDKLQTKYEEEDLYLKTMQENKEKNLKMFEEITQDVEAMNDQLLKIERDITTRLHAEFKEYTRIKEENVHNQNQTLRNSEILNKEYSDTKMLLTETDNASSTIIKNFTAELESKKNLLAESEKEFVSLKAKEVEVSNENNQIRLKIGISSDDVENMKINFEAIYKEGEEILRNTAKVEEENKQLSNDYEGLKNMPNWKNDLCDKESELQELKSSLNTELLNIEEHIKKLEYEYSLKNLNLQSDIQKNDLLNTQNRETLEKLQSNLKDLELKYTQLEAEKKNLQKAKTLMRQPCNKKTEAEKRRKVKLVPTPSLQRHSQPQLPKKRPLLLGTESDSSVDGERISYEEFVARKKRLSKINKDK